MRVWNLRTGQCIGRLGGHGGAVYCVLLLPPRHSLIVSGSFDRTIKCWRTPAAGQRSRTGGDGHDDAAVAEACMASLVHHRSWVMSLQFIDRADQLVSGGADGEVIVWCCISWRPLYTLAGPQARSTTGALLRCMAADEYKVVYSVQSSVRVCRLGSGDTGALYSLSRHNDDVTAVSMREDMVATGSTDKFGAARGARQASCAMRTHSPHAVAAPSPLAEAQDHSSLGFPLGVRSLQQNAQLPHQPSASCAGQVELGVYTGAVRAAVRAAPASDRVANDRQRDAARSELRIAPAGFDNAYKVVLLHIADVVDDRLQ